MPFPIPPILAAAAPAFLFEAVCLLFAGAVIAYLCSRIGLVPIVGFLAAGVLIGPNALGLVTNQALVDQAAELGVILLLFTIGIEFSLEKLNRIRRLIFGGGGLQVTLATLLTAGILRLFDLDWPTAIFSGFLVALSSTAIVLKLLGDRGETGTGHGRIGLGFLIFQDLGIIAMVMLVPALAGQGGGATEIALALGKAAVLIVIALTAARRLMPPVLERVAQTCSQEVFLLSVIAICLGTAYLTSLAGISVSLGAFLAGLVVSESRFSHHAFAEIMPLQILFSATFFVSVGMLLDVQYLIQNLPMVLLVVAGVLVVKVATTAVAALALGESWKVSLGAGLLLAQVGEFSFVLERAGQPMGLQPFGLGSQTFIAATVVLMVATPMLAQLGSSIAQRRDEATPPPETDADSGHMDDEFSGLREHVLVAGYGPSARRLTRTLHEHDLPLAVITLSPSGADEVETLGIPVLRGDNRKTEALRHAGIERAKLLVVADDEATNAEAVVAVARSLNPGLRILVRTRSLTSCAALAESGADLVAADDLEATLLLASESLGAFGLDPQTIHRDGETFRRAEIRSASSSAAARPEVLSPMVQKIAFDPEATIEPPASSASCTHLEQTRPVQPSAHGCEECLETGDRWVHLRICLTCGHVGCCDSSAHQHATRHHHETGHPIAASLEPGEDWAWCYLDERMV